MIVQKSCGKSEFPKDPLDLIRLFGEVLQQLEDAKVIRTRNVVGEIGEYLAIQHYCHSDGLPNLLATPTSLPNFDATAPNGDRYSIKTTTTNTTGVFHGVDDDLPPDQHPKLFEYALVVILDRRMNLLRINEVTWDQFLRFKRRHKTMKWPQLSITRRLLDETRTVYISDNVRGGRPPRTVRPKGSRLLTPVDA